MTKHLEKVCEDCTPLTKKEIKKLNKITHNQYHSHFNKHPSWEYMNSESNK